MIKVVAPVIRRDPLCLPQLPRPTRPECFKVRPADGLSMDPLSITAAVLGGHTASQASTSSLSDGEPAVGNDGATDDGLRILISQRAPCRSWCPCKCHAQRKAKMTMTGFVERLLGAIFVGYAGFPILNAPCDFRGCRDPQHPAAVIEYWFPG